MTQNEVIGTLLMENIELKQRVGQLEEVIKQLHQQHAENEAKKEEEVG